MTRYLICEQAFFRNGADEIVRVFAVQKSGKDWPIPHVWVGKGYVRCAGCQSLMRAMSSSCPHALAVKRFLKAKKALETKAKVG